MKVTPILLLLLLGLINSFTINTIFECSIGKETPWQEAPIYYDGRIFYARYSQYAINASDGSLIWRKNYVHSGGHAMRSYGSPVLVPMCAHGKPCLAVGSVRSLLQIRDLETGEPISGQWPKFTDNDESNHEVRANLAYLRKSTNRWVVCVGLAKYPGKRNIICYDTNGTLIFAMRPDNTAEDKPGVYTGISGVYLNNFCACDTEGDGRKSIFCPSDQFYSVGVEDDGTPILNYQKDNATYIANYGKTFGFIPHFVKQEDETRGYMSCSTAGYSWRSEGTMSGCSCMPNPTNPAKKLYSALMSSYDCQNSWISQYLTATLYVREKDGRRFVGGGYDTTEVYHTGKVTTFIRNSDSGSSREHHLVAAIGDINGDGKLEYVFGGRDCKIHAVDLNMQSLPGFPAVYQTDEKECHSDVVLGDLDGDGKQEIIFGTFSDTRKGRLIVMNGQGTIVNDMQVPVNVARDNGVMAPPTLYEDPVSKNIRVAVQINNYECGVCVYEFANTQNHGKLHWPTGGGDFQRSGNCQDCTTGGALSCNPGQYVDGTKCINCPTGCNTCTGKNACLSCSSGYYLNETCIKCPQNCIACSKATQCDQCDSGFAVLNGECKDCYASMTCEKCETNGHCSKCKSKLFFNVTSLECEKCSANCKECDGASCTACEEGYGGSSTDVRLCVKCPSNCHTCVDNECLYCMFNYFLAEEECKACKSGCKTCTTAEDCQACVSGKYLLEGNCANCIKNCDVCSSDSTCVTCLSGYFVDANTTCSSCGVAKCSTCSAAGTCLTCIEGYKTTAEGKCEEAIATKKFKISVNAPLTSEESQALQAFIEDAVGTDSSVRMIVVDPKTIEVEIKNTDGVDEDAVDALVEAINAKETLPAGVKEKVVSAGIVSGVTAITPQWLWLATLFAANW